MEGACCTPGGTGGDRWQSSTMSSTPKSLAADSERWLGLRVIAEKQLGGSGRWVATCDCCCQVQPFATSSIPLVTSAGRLWDVNILCWRFALRGFLRRRPLAKRSRWFCAARVIRVGGLTRSWKRHTSEKRVSPSAPLNSQNASPYKQEEWKARGQGLTPLKASVCHLRLGRCSIWKSPSRLSVFVNPPHSNMHWETGSNWQLCATRAAGRGEPLCPRHTSLCQFHVLRSRQYT
mmetsp:Transcript_33296/g.52074  ORF Transcript_33296/g.52074 Transcript_33296/m.52074 type:complete len:234 (-) Transcript_33296:861-1562(-)